MITKACPCQGVTIGNQTPNLWLHSQILVLLSYAAVMASQIHGILQLDVFAFCLYFAVTVQCLRDGHFIVVVSRDMLDYPIILDSVKLSYAQAGCDPVRKTESFLVFRFPLTQCGTTVQVRYSLGRCGFTWMFLPDDQLAR